MPGKLLLVVNHIDWFWSHRLPLARGAKEAGFEVVVACHGADGDPRLAEAGFRGVSLPGGSPFATLGALRAAVRDESPDVLHVITIKYAFLAGLATLGLGLPRIVHTIAGLGYLYTGEGVKPRLLRAALASFFRIALRRGNTHVIFQNPDDKTLLERLGLADPVRSHLIRGSGVDVDAFTVTPEPQGETLVLMPTRLVHEKGVAIFVEAARMLKAEGVQARFAIAGGLSRSNPRAITEAEMRAMTADGAAEWLGKIDDMPRLLAESALIVYPSYYGEGIPKVLLEAMAAGRAIVTTDHPGCREAVADRVNGLLVPVRNAPAVADAIRSFLDHPDERARMGAEGRERAEEEFRVERIVGETLKVYSGV